MTKYQQFLTRLNNGQAKHFEPDKSPDVTADTITFYLIPTIPPGPLAHLKSPRMEPVLEKAIKHAWGENAPENVIFETCKQSVIEGGELTGKGEWLTLGGEPIGEPEPPQTNVLHKGFTPVVDTLATKLGLVPAAIFGVVWRHCQMSSRTCYASQKTIAGRLNISRECVNRNIKKLLNDGYIRCLNDSEKGKTKVYITTNKISIQTSFVMEATVNGQA